MMGIFRRKPVVKDAVDNGGKGIKEKDEKDIGQQKVSEMDSTTKARYIPQDFSCPLSSQRMRHVRKNVS
jgi:hypothetical protein